MVRKFEDGSNKTEQTQLISICTGLLGLSSSKKQSVEKIKSKVSKSGKRYPQLTPIPEEASKNVYTPSDGNAAKISANGSG